MGNTETKKRMGRAGRVNVKRKNIENARAINHAQLRRPAGVLGKAKKRAKTFLTESTSLEVFAALILLEPFVIVRFATNPDWRTPPVTHYRIPLAFCAALICARASAARFLPHKGLFLLILRSLMI